MIIKIRLGGLKKSLRRYFLEKVCYNRSDGRDGYGKCLSYSGKYFEVRG